MQRIVRNWFIGLFALLYLATLFVYAGTGVFNAPDEHATSLFIERVREAGLPRIEELRNESVLNVLHPRSTTVIGNYIVPIGFLGMPFWYGILSSPFPFINSAVWVTPLLVFFTLGAWYAIMKKYLHSPRKALYATILLATLPAFWYYAARSFMPNVPFVGFLILAFVVFDLRPWKQVLPWWTYGTCAGFLFGVAISFRLFELPWILILLALYLFAARRVWHWQDLILFVCGAALALAPIFALQHTLYGSPFLTGYTARNAVTYAGGNPVLDTAVAAFAVPTAPAGWSNILFPFGIHERLIVSHVFENVFLLMPLFTVFSVLGVLFVLRAKQKKWWPLLAALTILAAWLFVVYGSWRIADNPDPHAVTLANSYSRYWLPIYVLAIPFVLIGMEKLAEIVSSRRVKEVLFGLVLVWVAFGACTILRGPDGVLATRARLSQFAEDRELLLEYIPENATVITYYADKYIYPHRPVVIGLTSHAVIHAMPALLAQTPLYYFGITLPSQDLAFYQKTLLDQLPEKYRLVPLIHVREQTLYRFERL